MTVYKVGTANYYADRVLLSLQQQQQQQQQQHDYGELICILHCVRE